MRARRHPITTLWENEVKGTSRGDTCIRLTPPLHDAGERAWVEIMTHGGALEGEGGDHQELVHGLLDMRGGGR